MNRHDIGDDEIRVISPHREPLKSSASKRRRHILWFGFACFLMVILSSIIFVRTIVLEENVEVIENQETDMIVGPEKSDEPVIIDRHEVFATIVDTIVNGVRLTILNPQNATPTLELGPDAINDSCVILAFQAADIRADNGKIAGAFIERGQLISKGQAKSGFCAILGKSMVIGVASSTPYLEEALDSEGYFFRQYPLVVAGQIVENKPKGRALRKALAELDGKIVVVISKNRLTFHDFSKSLVELGVSNAIYLVGGSGYGIARTEDGRIIEFGEKWFDSTDNVNFIIWKKPL